MMKETLTVRFLYKTVLGRSLLKILVHPTISKMAGRLLETSSSRWLVPFFVRKHNIDMSEYKERKFLSFNDFFTRKRENDKIDQNPKHLISPCDGYLSIYRVDEKQTYSIKNVEYKLDRLLQNSKLAERYAGGICLIFRLTPQEYHRYCYVCEGSRTEEGYISGKLHCVRPIAYTTIPVFIENSRAYTVIESEALGQMIQMEIGALMVGKIHNHEHGERIYRGQEKGYFEFGGSTILLLIEEKRVHILNEILQNTRDGHEVKVRLGEAVGILA